MSDAAHMLSDILGFVISIVSISISQKEATTHMSFGYHRAEVIGALVSVNIIWGLTIWLFYEATLRIISRDEVDGFIMLLTAILGFLFNIIMGVILSYQGIDHQMHGHSHDDDDHGHSHGDKSHAHGDHGHAHEDHGHAHEDHGHAHEDHGHSHDKVETDEQDKNHDHSHETNVIKEKKSNNHDHSHDDDNDHEEENINIRAALIHVVGDAVQNLGVIIAGLIIYFWPEYSIADPICTYIFSIIVLFTTIRILKSCISVLMEESPSKLDLEQLKKDLEAVCEGNYVECHDLHVWSLSHSKLSLSAHLISLNPDVVLQKALNVCKFGYGIKHSTIQVESPEGPNKCDDHSIHG